MMNNLKKTLLAIVLTGLFPGLSAAEVSPGLLRAYTLGIQEELAQRGLYRGPLDGVADVGTRHAIQSYQQMQALSADGEPSHQLLNHLKFVDPAAGGQWPSAAETVAYQPPVGAPLSLLPEKVQPLAPLQAQPQSAPEPITVEDVQWALWERGYYQGAIDGVPGPKTEQAIRDYQRDNGLPVTGKIDPSVTGEITWVNPQSPSQATSDQSIVWNN